MESIHVHFPEQQTAIRRKSSSSVSQLSHRSSFSSHRSKRGKCHGISVFEEQTFISHRIILLKPCAGCCGDPRGYWMLLLLSEEIGYEPKYLHVWTHSKPSKSSNGEPYFVIDYVFKTTLSKSWERNAQCGPDPEFLVQHNLQLEGMQSICIFHIYIWWHLKWEKVLIRYIETDDLSHLVKRMGLLYPECIYYQLRWLSRINQILAFIASLLFL